MLPNKYDVLSDFTFNNLENDTLSVKIAEPIRNKINNRNIIVNYKGTTNFLKPFLINWFFSFLMLTSVQY